MKKTIAITLTAAIMISMTACTSNSTDESSGSSILESGSQTESTGVTEVGVDVLDYYGHSFACFFGCQTWEEARDQCESMGGHLAVITSQEEDEAVFAFTRYCGYDNVYIGYSDIEEEGNWQWVTGETSDYSNWNESEPNGFTPNENYAVYGDNGAWYDGEFTPRIENGLISFICEWDYHVDGASNISSEELQTYIDGLEAVATETEPVAETQVPSEEIRTAAYASYLGIIEANENAIRSCNAFDSYDCALADVTGDGIEDLVITTVGSYPAYGTIDVYSYNASTNSANNILRLEDIYPTGQMGDVFVAVSDDGQLLIYYDGVGSQASNYNYVVYGYDGNSLIPVNTVKYIVYYEAAVDFGDPESSYTINDEDVTQNVFNSEETAIIDSISKLLQHTPEYGDFSGWFEQAFNVVSSVDSIAMTYDGMHSYLVSNSGTNALPDDQDQSNSESNSDLPSDVASLIAQYTSSDTGYINLDSMLEDMGFQLGNSGFSSGDMIVCFDFDGWADGSDEESTYYDFPNSMIIEIGGFDYANGVCNRDVYTRECSSPALYYIYYGHNVHPVGSQDIIALYDAITYGNLNGYELSLSFTYPL